MDKIAIVFLILAMTFLNCVHSLQDDCYYYAELDGKLQNCDPVGNLLMFESANTAKTPEDKKNTLDIILLSCLQRAEIDRKCRAKSRYIYVPYF